MLRPTKIKNNLKAIHNKNQGLLTDWEVASDQDKEQFESDSQPTPGSLFR